MKTKKEKKEKPPHKVKPISRHKSQQQNYYLTIVVIIIIIIIPTTAKGQFPAKSNTDHKYPRWVQSIKATLLYIT